MPPPLVSIITPSFNQGRFLEATIRSTLAQDYAPVEYMIFDGGSNDGSVDIIQRYANRLAYWESRPDRGQAHAINKGLQRATGEILGWLNSDDILLPGAVQLAVDTFRQRPEIDVVYGRLERIDEAGRVLPTPTLPKDRATFGPSHVIGECIVNQPGSFWRRRAMEKFGLLDESLNYSMDYEYWIRLAVGGARFERRPETVAQFRLSAGSKTVGQTAAQAEEQLRTLTGVLARPDLAQRLGLSPDEVERQARRARARIALHAAYGRYKLRDFRLALRWLVFALRHDPSAPLERRWLDLGLARLQRRRRA